MKNILVTGTEGFIGSRFVELNGDKYNIISLDKFGANSFLLYPDDLKPYLKNNKIKAIFHFGALTDTTSQDIQENFLYNVLFTQMLIDECAAKNIPLIFSSSASLYGSGNSIPLNLYAWTKKVSEDYGVLKSNLIYPSVAENSNIIGGRGFQFTALRYFNVYGIGEHNKNIRMTSLVYQNLSKDKIKLFRGKPKRDFVFVDDIISANIHALETGQSGTFDCGYGEARPFEDIAAGLGAEIEYVDNPIKGQYQSFTLSDRNKWLKNWTPKYNLEAGIKKTREYYGK